MISFDDAYRIALSVAHPLGTEKVPFGTALRRVLAQDVVSDVDMPPFNKSAMDGFACRRADLGGALRVVESVPAGAWPTRRVEPGECCRIMTGAPVPDGADCVILLEETLSEEPDRVRFRGSSTADNICPKGEDVKAGDTLLPRGTVLAPAHLATLAAAGCVKPEVFLQPQVGIMATGNELVEPHRTPGKGQIRDSNSAQLHAQLAAMGIEADEVGVLADTERATDEAVRQSIVEHDVLLASGGASAGDFDLVSASFVRCGLKPEFESVAMQPGKPTVFARGKGAFAWGMPGNPVSAFVVFELLVKPFLYRLMGADYRPRIVVARLDGEFRRRKADRQLAVPVALSAPGRVRLLEYHGSAHIQSLAGADGLLVVPPGVDGFAKDAEVHVRLLA